MLILVIIILSGATPVEDNDRSAIWSGLKVGLEQNGVPGQCMNSYPVLISGYDAYISSLSSSTIKAKLLGIKALSNGLTQFVNVCQFKNLVDKVFGIYQWSVLQPILITIASNTTYFLELVEYLNLAIENEFYYNIGLYGGRLISLLFGFYI
jgi:hypothetical protein